MNQDISNQLKDLRNKIAKIVHPDVAGNDPIKVLYNHKMMTEVNVAYASNDLLGLEAIYELVASQGHCTENVNHSKSDSFAPKSNLHAKSKNHNEDQASEYIVITCLVCQQRIRSKTSRHNTNMRCRTCGNWFAQGMHKEKPHSKPNEYEHTKTCGENGTNKPLPHEPKWGDPDYDKATMLLNQAKEVFKKGVEKRDGWLSKSGLRNKLSIVDNEFAEAWKLVESCEKHAHTDQLVSKCRDFLFDITSTTLFWLVALGHKSKKQVSAQCFHKAFCIYVKCLNSPKIISSEDIGGFLLYALTQSLKISREPAESLPPKLKIIRELCLGLKDHRIREAPLYQRSAVSDEIYSILHLSNQKTWSINEMVQHEQFRRGNVGIELMRLLVDITPDSKIRQECESIVKESDRTGKMMGLGCLGIIVIGILVIIIIGYMKN